MILPSEVVERDKKLDKEITHKTEELMELRWHWTLDKDNPDRVTAAAYAREVGRARQVISRDANAWARWLADQSKRTGTSAPNAAQTPADFRELANLSEEKRQAAAAVAKATSKKVGSVVRNSRDEIHVVLAGARDAAVQRGTSVESEIAGVAEARAKARAAEAERAAKACSEREKLSASLSRAGKNYWAEKKAAEAKCRTEYLALQKRIDAAVSALENGLCDAGTIPFTKEEADALHGSLDRLSVLVGQVQARIRKASGSATGPTLSASHRRTVFVVDPPIPLSERAIHAT